MFCKEAINLTRYLIPKDINLAIVRVSRAIGYNRQHLANSAGSDRGIRIVSLPVGSNASVVRFHRIKINGSMSAG